MITISNYQFPIINYKYKNTSHRGFTLIELLIVMTIIALLAGLSLFAVGGVRESARDGRRKSDLEVIRSALELYKADCNVYPGSITGGGTLSAPASCGVGSVTYLQKVPQDPIGGDYRYCPAAGNIRYSLYTHLEDDTNTEAACGSCANGVCRYVVTSP